MMEAKTARSARAGDMVHRGCPGERPLPAVMTYVSKFVRSFAVSVISVTGAQWELPAS